MKRTFAAFVMAVTASTSIWLAASAPAEAAASAAATAAKPGPPPEPSATLHVAPRWTYRGGGKIAVTASCLERRDLPVVTSRMLPHPVLLRKGPNLLIKVTRKTRPGKYVITLWCVSKHNMVVAMEVKPVTIRKRLGGFKQPPPPGLPKHFKANATVFSGPPVRAKNPHGKKKGR